MKLKPKVWKYRLSEPYIFQASVLPDFRNWQTDTVFFTDDNDRLWLSIQIDGTITIEAAYCWDGCSPKWQLGGFIFGTPDGATNPQTGYPYTYDGSLPHDALLQWEQHPNMPYSRAEIDRIFHDQLVAAGFPAARLYYRAVRLYSRWVGLWRKIPSLRISL